MTIISDLSALIHFNLFQELYMAVPVVHVALSVCYGHWCSFVLLLHTDPLPLPLLYLLLTQHLVQLLSQFNRAPLSLCGKGFCVVWTKATTPSACDVKAWWACIIGTVQGLGWTLLATRGV